MDDESNNKSKSDETTADKKSTSLILSSVNSWHIALLLVIASGAIFFSAIFNFVFQDKIGGAIKLEFVDRWAISFGTLVFSAPVLLFAVFFARKTSSNSNQSQLLVSAGIIAVCFGVIHILTSLFELFHVGPQIIGTIKSRLAGEIPSPASAVFPFVGTSKIGLLLNNLCYVLVFAAAGLWAFSPISDKD